MKNKKDFTKGFFISIVIAYIFGVTISFPALAKTTFDWHLVMNNNTCQISNFYGEHLSPAQLIQADKNMGLQDNVTILERNEDNLPILVQVGEPQGNGMEEVYTFARGKSECLSYANKQKSKYNGLN